VLRVTLDYYGLLEQLIESERISEADDLDRRKVEAAVARLLCDWKKRWREFG
jgi:hypothetical protein